MSAVDRNDLERARQRLDELLAEHESVEVEIAREKRRIAALTQLVEGDAPETDDLGGLSEACRSAFRASRKEWLGLADVRNGLRELRFPVNRYKSLAAMVVVTVNRMVEAGEVQLIRTKEGRKAFKWLGVSGSSRGRSLRKSSSRGKNVVDAR
jgi:hypothetical protein